MTVLARVAADDGVPHVGIVEGGSVRLTPHRSLLDWHDAGEPVRASATRGSLDWSALQQAAGYRLLAPIDPPEVWACGFTYERGPQFAASPVIPSGPAYEHAIAAGRPEIFFKTTGWRVVGPGGDIGIRGDSRHTAVEAELCLILDEDGRPVFAIAGNDVSAWDIEAKNPLWLAQGKTFEACCALGPVAVTLDEIPEDAEVRCGVFRGSRRIFEGSIPLSRLRWSFQELADFASAFNPLPPGSVLMTGTAIIRPDAEGLRPGDVVEVSIDGIGTLRNVAKLLTSRAPVVPWE